MKRTEKQLYAAPSAEVFELVQEGVICDSQQQSQSMTRNDYDWEEW